MQAHVCLPVRSTPWWMLLHHPSMLQLFFIIKCAMRVFDVRASSSSPRLPLCSILFLSWPPLVRKTAYSITHPAYLMPWESKCKGTDNYCINTDKQTKTDSGRNNTSLTEVINTICCGHGVSLLRAWACSPQKSNFSNIFPIWQTF